jgi:hypothetical protein
MDTVWTIKWNAVKEHQAGNTLALMNTLDHLVEVAKYEGKADCPSATPTEKVAIFEISRLVIEAKALGPNFIQFIKFLRSESGIVLSDKGDFIPLRLAKEAAEAVYAYAGQGHLGTGSSVVGKHAGDTQWLMHFVEQAFGDYSPEYKVYFKA